MNASPDLLFVISHSDFCALEILKTRKAYPTSHVILRYYKHYGRRIGYSSFWRYSIKNDGHVPDMFLLLCSILRKFKSQGIYFIEGDFKYLSVFDVDCLVSITEHIILQLVNHTLVW